MTKVSSYFKALTCWKQPKLMMIVKYFHWSFFNVKYFHWFYFSNEGNLPISSEQTLNFALSHSFFAMRRLLLLAYGNKQLIYIHNFWQTDNIFVKKILFSFARITAVVIKVFRNYIIFVIWIKNIVSFTGITDEINFWL